MQWKRLAGMRTTIAAALCLASLSVGASEAPPEPYSLEYWALRDTFRNVGLSADGTYMGLLRIPNRGADPIIEVYETADLEKEPFRLNADPMEITGYSWISDTALVFSLRQRVRDQIEGFNRGVYEYKLVMLNVPDKTMKDLSDQNVGVAHPCPSSRTRSSSRNIRR